jgi:hypothetical protein
MSTRQSTFQRLVNPASVAALEAELKQERARFQRRFEEYEHLREELGSLSDSISRQQQVIDAIRSALPAEGNENGAATEGAPERAMTKREIAIEVLRGSIQPLYPREVREIAMKRGLLSNSRGAANQLSVAMSKGVHAGIFVRDDEGRYSLPEES